MTHRPKTPALARVYAWFSAISANDTGLLKDLLTHGILIDVQHPLRHSTALMEATRLGRVSLVHWLLEHGAAPAFLSGLPKTTALHYALRHQHWEIASIILHRTSDCSVIDTQGATALHTLCAESYHADDETQLLALAALMITKKCALNTADAEGAGALHHCVINDRRQLASMLLSHGADPNMQIPGSRVTPLMIAALDRNSDMAQLLMQHGADPHARTREGATPASTFPALARLAIHHSPAKVRNTQTSTTSTITAG